jgi:hypothetical protein
MANHILLRNSDDVILEEVDGDKRFRSGKPPILKPEKGLRWLPLIIVDPPFDLTTQNRTGPVDVLTVTELTRTFSISAKSATEMQDEADTASATGPAVASIINTLVNASVLNSTDFDADLILQVNAKNRLDRRAEI